MPLPWQTPQVMEYDMTSPFNVYMVKRPKVLYDIRASWYDSAGKLVLVQYYPGGSKLDMQKLSQHVPNAVRVLVDAVAA